MNTKFSSRTVHAKKGKFSREKFYMPRCLVSTMISIKEATKAIKVLAAALLPRFSRKESDGYQGYVTDLQREITALRV